MTQISLVSYLPALHHAVVGGVCLLWEVDFVRKEATPQFHLLWEDFVWKEQVCYVWEDHFLREETSPHLKLSQHSWKETPQLHFQSSPSTIHRQTPQSPPLPEDIIRKRLYSLR